MAVHLPSDPSLITENWQDNIPGLFPNLEPAIVNGSNFNDGSIIKVRLQILDQLESEIFFPIIEVKDANNQVKNDVTIFREKLNIPDECEIIEKTDFASATERKVFLAAHDSFGHNHDKQQTKMQLKVYSKNSNLRVLQLYDVTGVYYDGGIVHVIEFTETGLGKVGNNVSMHEKLSNLCSKAMFNDQLAGQLLMSSFISEVYLRRDVLSLGKFCLHLNRKNFNDNDSAAIINSICQLYQNCRVFEMTLKNLNEKPLNPIKDYDTETLVHSELSLPDGTLLILDETKLTQGKLTEIGTQNIGHLVKLIEQQKVSFDYQFYQKDFDVKINTIIISNGKSILPHDYSIKLKPEIESNEVHVSETEKEDINKWIINSKAINYQLTDDEMAQKFIMETRKADNNTGVEELHKIMVLGRSMTIAKGLSEPTREILEEARSLSKKICDRE